METFLQDFLKQRPLPSNLREAVSYALFGPGKRLRPLLTLRSCEAVGGCVDDAMAAAGAIEMIHAFSLVHDDLPAMDDDDLRRGRPTLHRHSSEAMAILGGDALMGLAFELLAARAPSPQSGFALMRELAQGANDMIAGQVYDTMPDFDAAVEPMTRLETIHRYKTGALICCACRMGGICGNASADQLQALTRYAQAIGLLYQVVDDILDVTQTTQHLGKAAGKDQGKGKLTYPGLLGLERSQVEVLRLVDQAYLALDGLGTAGKAQDPTRHLRQLCDYIAVRSK